MLDPSQPRNEGSKDLNAIIVDVYRFIANKVKPTVEDAQKRQQDDKRKAAPRREAPNQHPSDDFRLEKRVDTDSWKKGIQHTHK